MRIFAIVALAAFSGTGCFAQSVEWSGVYAGFGVGANRGNLVVESATEFDLNDNKPSLSAFAGYNVQSGSMVYGGELAYTSAELALDGFPDQYYGQFLDLKGRVGYATGPALIYGVLGYSTDVFDVPGGSSNGGGFSYGIGADMKVGERYFVGAEYLHRDVQNDGNTEVGDIDSKIGTVSLRVGMTF